MTYQIQSKSDLSTGVSLIVRVPESDIDQKALQTLLADRPDYVLPFRYKSIDGEMEFTYQAGTLSKLQHLSGMRSPDEYARLWTSILEPLLECDDWFMKPYSFAMKTEILYIDKNTQNISYVYIPSRRDCSDKNDLSEMVKDLSKQNPVADTDLQNKVLWAIVDDFNPKEFLQMLKPYETKTVKTTAQAAPSTSVPIDSAAKQQSVIPDVQKQTAKKAEADTPAQPPQIELPVMPADGLKIDLSASEKKGKEKLAKGKGKGLFGKKKEKEEKPTKKTTGGLFKKKSSEQEIIAGASAEALSSVKPVVDYSGRNVVQVSVAVQSNDDPITELLEEESGIGLKYIGNASLPNFIAVNIFPGASFSIGRFDMTVGHKQSSFEFDKSTKAVSRRHAVIERDGEGYKIIDLSSAAGTFVNGQRVLANTPFRLERGCRVSFGNSGTDYTWDE